MSYNEQFGEQKGERQYGDDESTEKSGFMKGFMNEKEGSVCAECDSAVDQEEIISKDFDGEQQIFCSKSCVEDFSESF
ncbi:hypothetical protein HOD05_02755 [Candidatus Woesearchaeota archaeon]|jgi:hypothetical protein|nr:hypothetical protein [Candidatus Woesearchaeota archaeon]MBT4151292.1 hypothetical protein [Candidatus Woesearchaeota archaeon]MBT4247471.1 hypothetical protein [Candidatus Woesearchaeota archaeon]MBT4434114.1 hypothetical protein [Candidatus Woesearchaeota archaeon]MBT7332237.1 hypothetical protein [Candidatus Woesearchaeota archaeon]